MREFFIVLVAMAFSVFGDQQNQDFCEAFADNGFQISYGYSEYREYVQGGYGVFLFIGHHYWQLNGSKNALFFHSNRSQIIDNWFGEDYNIAIDMTFCKHSDCRVFAGLLKVS